MNYLSRRGFTWPKLAVTASMFLIALGASVILIPLAITRTPSLELYGLYSLIIGGFIGTLLFFWSSRLLSFTSPEYVEYNVIVALADKAGWIHLTRLEKVPRERHVRTDAGTTTELELLRNALYSTMFPILVIAVDYVFLLAQRWLH